MISYIEGQVLFKDAGYAVIKANGVGYHVFLNKKDWDQLTALDNTHFYIHTHLREDAIELYGFSSLSHKQLFLLLISVSGVGPKLGLNVLSTLSPPELLNALIDKDLALLSKIPGVGKKTAERLSLELKDKALKVEMELPIKSLDDKWSLLDQAIRGLGYSKGQSEKALLILHQDEFKILPLEDLVKKALSHLTGSLP